MPEGTSEQDGYERIPTRLDGIPGIPGHTRVESVRGYDLCCQECSTEHRDYVGWPCMGVVRHVSSLVLDNVRESLRAAMHDPFDFRCSERPPDSPSKPDARCPTCRAQKAASS